MNLRWNTSEYGGVKDLRIPPHRLWKPDVLMYNRQVCLGFVSINTISSFKEARRPCRRNTGLNIDEPFHCSADEGFDGTYATNVVVRNNGSCMYVPPGIFKSTCKIDITWFPFDDQRCEMKFGSWTYDGFQVCRKRVICRVCSATTNDHPSIYFSFFVYPISWTCSCRTSRAATLKVL